MTTSLNSRSIGTPLSSPAGEPPLPLPPFTLYQVWHERRQEDPAHAWLRGVLAEIARALQTGFNHYLVKPLQITRLLTILSTLPTTQAAPPH